MTSWTLARLRACGAGARDGDGRDWAAGGSLSALLLLGYVCGGELISAGMLGLEEAADLGLPPAGGAPWCFWS